MTSAFGHTVSTLAFTGDLLRTSSSLSFDVQQETESGNCTGRSEESVSVGECVCRSGRVEQAGKRVMSEAAEM